MVEAENIIDQRVDGFHWLDTIRGTVPTTRALREHADHLRWAEVERAVRPLAKGEDPAKVIEAPAATASAPQAPIAPLASSTKLTGAGRLR